MVRARIAVMVVPALSFSLLAPASAQVPDAPPAPPASATPSRKAVPSDASTGLQPVQSNTAPVFRPSDAPVKRLTTPGPTPVMPLPGNSPLGGRPSAVAPPAEAPRMELPIPGGPVPETGKASSGSGSNLPASPTVDAISNSPSETAAEPLPEVPDPANASGEVGGTTAPGVGSSPLLAPILERDPSVAVTPVPVLQLSIVYGLILLFAAGYFWYTARLGKAESSRDA